jgi:hypothetical protein
MGYTPKPRTNNERPQTNNNTQQSTQAGAANSNAPKKTAIAGSLHCTPIGEKKGERICNLFLNEKDGKRWLSGKAEDGTRFSIFLNDPK